MKGKQLTDRRNRILEMLAEQDELPVSYLISTLKVSDETIRKDLIEMERQGMIQRMHGSCLLYTSRCV